jgi:hypothetical protein
MRWGILALALSGCLYVGDVNRAPSASLTVMDPPETLIKGARLRLVATVGDPEDGSDLPPIWSVELLDENPDFDPDPNCDYRLTPLQALTAGKPEAEVVFNRTGNWLVSVHTLDQYNAKSNTSTVMVQVVDSPPTLDPGQLDLAAGDAKHAQCGTYTANQPLTLFYDAEVVDLDARLDAASFSCNQKDYDEVLVYRWEILAMPATSHAVLGAKPSKDSQLLGDAPCPSARPAGLSRTFIPGEKDYPRAVCLYPDEGGTLTSFDYQVAMFVSDGKTEVRTNVFVAPVRADVQPCVTGTAPAPGAYVVDRNEVQRFSVTGVTDDLDGFGTANLTYQWSIWRELDPVWRTVPAWTLSTYELDTATFAVGENLRVRVQPIDRLGKRDGCDLEDGACAIDSCLLGAGQTCQAWMTWDLELR